VRRRSVKGCSEPRKWPRSGPEARSPQPPGSSRVAVLGLSGCRAGTEYPWSSGRCRGIDDWTLDCLPAGRCRRRAPPNPSTER